jgi:hypothetical protein
MRFLYFRSSIPLEDLCEKWHFVARAGSRNLSQINASVCKRKLAPMRRNGRPGRTEMLDIILLAIGLGFFALSVGYVMACDQL